MSVQEQLLALMTKYAELQVENSKLRQAILNFGNSEVGFDWAVLDRIDDT